MQIAISTDENLTQEEQIVLDYLKLIGKDLINFKSKCIINLCSINIYDFSFCLETTLLNEADAKQVSDNFNTFIQTFEWCVNVQIPEILDDDDIDFASIIWETPFVNDKIINGTVLCAFTETDHYDKTLYLTIKLDG